MMAFKLVPVRAMSVAFFSTAALLTQSGRADTFVYNLGALAGSPTTVTVGPYTYSNFGATSADVDPSTVTVTVSNDPGLPNLRLAFASLTSVNVSSPDLVFSYDITSSGPSLNQAYLAVGGVRTGSGEGSVVEAIYDATSIATLTNGPINQFSVSLDSNTTASATLVGTYTHLHYEKDVQVVGGGLSDPGTATITTVDNSVPEPATVGLMATAACGLLIRRRQRV